VISCVGGFVFFSVCLSVRAVKSKRLELSTPKSAVDFRALTRSQKVEGHFARV